MYPSAAPAGIHGSPKRKRGALDSIEHAPGSWPATPDIAIDCSAHSSLHESIERRRGSREISPSSRMAGQLRHLDLQGTFVRQIPFTNSSRARNLVGISADKSTVAPDTGIDSDEDESVSSKIDALHTSAPEKSRLEYQTIKPSPSAVDRPRSRRRSPAPERDSIENHMTWHESEITGHNPTDPTDDGYGINGIGFKPSPAVAWARYQKRKQQLADCKSREAREARQRRNERRRAESRELSPEKDEMVKKRRAKVRFGDVNGAHINVS